MQDADVRRLSALAMEAEVLAVKIRKCAEHTQYAPPKGSKDQAALMTKFHRTDAQVAVWLDEFEATVGRIRQLRASVPSLNDG
jgi:hypothetical protein